MNVIVAGFEVDAYWPRAKLVAELDGYAFHRSPTPTAPAPRSAVFWEANRVRLDSGGKLGAPSLKVPTENLYGEMSAGSGTLR
jgi:hypothetical protein